MRERLRIFVSSPGDVTSAREIAALTIERLAQDYARYLIVEPYLWEFEAMVASGHFQDSIEPPSAFDVVVLILWSRLGSHLPERTTVREYRGVDGRTPLTGTEWEFEEAMQAAKETGAPDLLVYRNFSPAPFDTRDAGRFEQQLQQLKALNRFWERHFANKGMFIGAYTSFIRDAEFAVALENHLRKLIERRIAAIGVGAGDDMTGKAWMQAPFRGLEAYEFEHAPIFFGQDEALAKAMLQLTANADTGSPFLLVLGASGSGKSSLVKAGIVPKLFVPRRVPGTAFLRRVIFRPSDAQGGEDLFDAVARRLTTQVSDQEGLSELLGDGQSSTSLSLHLRNATAAPAFPLERALRQLTVEACRSGRMLEYETAKLVLVVDQLEELFTAERISSNERVQFVELLGGLARSGLIWVVATMRKDFWHRADETPELVRLSEGNGRLELVPPLPSQLSQIIRRPAEAAGTHFEMHGTTNVPLNDVISEEVAGEPGALPLLSYLLDQLYRIDVLETRGSTLTYVTYDRLGKLEGAVATQAEAVLERCLPEDRAALGSVLFSLVDMGPAEGNVERAIARRVPLSTFTPGTPQRRLVEALLDPDARLLVSGTEKEGSPTVRIAHEALITRWAQARDFVQSNAEALKIRHRIEERYSLWRGLKEGTQVLESAPPAAKLLVWRSQLGRERGLLTDIDLVDGRRLLKEHQPDTEPHLVSYIERSIATNHRARTRTFRLLTIVISVVTLLAIAASGAGWLALKKQHEAEYRTTEAIQAQARLLIDAAAQRVRDDNIVSAQGIILEVLTNSDFARARTAPAITVFQEVRAVDRQIAVLSGHGGEILSAAYSPDGSRAVTGSYDQTARIWDAKTGAQLLVLLGHGGIVASAAYSSDGTRLVTASADKTARIWDARTGRQLAVLSGHDGAVRAAAYSPDGTRIATASYDKTARVWDAKLGTQLLVLSGHSDRVVCAGYSPDGDRIVTASFDKTARIWDAHTGVLLRILNGHNNEVLTAAYSPDGMRVVTASADLTARIWNARTGERVRELSGYGNIVSSAAYSPDGKRVVTANDNMARIWDASTGILVSTFSGHRDTVQSAVYSPDGKRIITASDDKTARIWDSREGAQLAMLSGHSDEVMAAAYSPDGTRILTVSLDQTARIWDTHTNAQLTVLSKNSGIGAAYSRDGTHIVTTSRGSTAFVWDARTGVRLATLVGHTDQVMSAAYSPDGSRIVTASADGTARIWDTQSGNPLRVLSGHTGPVSTAAYAPDGSHIVTASRDKSVRLWDSRTAAPISVLAGHSDVVESAQYSLDGARIVSASDDQTARVWDARTGMQLAVLAGHRGGVASAAFSPNGAYIVTASADKTARIWNASTGVPITVLSGHSAAVQSAMYSPDGKHIVTASDDRTARIWDASVTPDIDTQVLWYRSAEIDALRNDERLQLGLPVSPQAALPTQGAACLQSSGAFYDPDRKAPGISPLAIDPEIASTACSLAIEQFGDSSRWAYQMGRALLAKKDVQGARREFEKALSDGYRASRIDLALLLLDASGGTLDPGRSISLYEQAWESGVSISAFYLGNLYEFGVQGSKASAGFALLPNLTRAWVWYKKGAEAGEPNALARLAQRDELNALAEETSAKANASLLSAFRYYAAAAERAGAENWPDDAWNHWRYRRATLARTLASEGMMQQVADTYRTVRDKWDPQPPTTWEIIKTKLHL